MSTTDVLLGDGGITHRTTSTMKRHLSLLYVDVLKRMDTPCSGIAEYQREGNTYSCRDLGFCISGGMDHVTRWIKS
eukprot:scaffold29674_cov175-Skeletonema_dohrnii-CCMP3373.AAC.2